MLALRPLAGNDGGAEHRTPIEPHARSIKAGEMLRGVVIGRVTVARKKIFVIFDE